MAGPIITLTTDFGASDPVVGAMKAVILGINPHATLVDITHEVPPQDISGGAFLFDTAFPYFSPNTIHVLVVDPGVGTERRPIFLQGPTGCFVAPDNGLLSYALARAGVFLPTSEASSSGSVSVPSGWKAYHLTNDQYWHNPVSNTFHGRDVFAPAAAYLSRGVQPERMGAVIDTLRVFPILQPQKKHRYLTGCVLRVDHFGNLITNVPASSLADAHGSIIVEVGGQKLHGLADSYQDGTPLLAILGSHGYLEISARSGNAAQALGLGVGAEVQVGLAPSP